MTSTSTLPTEASSGEMKEHQGHDLASLLPEDVLADGVLRRLGPRWLAASRCVCKAWRAVVDDRRLLRADLLPLSLDGIIIDFNRLNPEFFSRPSTGPSISGMLDYFNTSDAWSTWAMDHCNGLLLLDKHVANPAEGWAAPLPACPTPSTAMVVADFYKKYLLFDPTLSADYEVFSVPRFFPPEAFLNNSFTDRLDPVVEESEWPPSTFIMHVFSSRLGRWEERPFVREGEAAGTVADMRMIWEKRYAVYWRGSLYVHCQTDFVMRISSTNSKYQVIKPPMDIRRVNEYPELHLGRSKKGVYFASLYDTWLRVWILNESCGHMEWTLKHDNNLEPLLPREYRHEYNRHGHGPWIHYSFPCDNKEVMSEEKFEWTSDIDDTLNDRDMVKEGDRGYIEILGFHPYKEIVFLSQCMMTGLAYHLNSSRIQVLGKLYPPDYTEYDMSIEFQEGYYKEICASFPYTPCWIEWPGNN